MYWTGISAAHRTAAAFALLRLIMPGFCSFPMPPGLTPKS
jgi:hypothetical protein